MGSLTSRQNAGVEEVDITSNHAYKYPPRSGIRFQLCITSCCIYKICITFYYTLLICELLPTGSYFGSHFIMGGERFDTPQPEAYLFGENADLNFLGSRPTPVRTLYIKIIFSMLEKFSFTKDLFECKDIAVHRLQTFHLFSIVNISDLRILCSHCSFHILHHKPTILQRH